MKLVGGNPISLPHSLLSPVWLLDSPAATAKSYVGLWAVQKPPPGLLQSPSNPWPVPLPGPRQFPGCITSGPSTDSQTAGLLLLDFAQPLGSPWAVLLIAVYPMQFLRFSGGVCHMASILHGSNHTSRPHLCLCWIQHSSWASFLIAFNSELFLL